MAYDAATRVWYGPESYQHAMFYHPAGHTIGTDPDLPVIVYRPGGGWAGADVDDMLLSRGWWRYGLGDATSPHVDSYAVFVVNTASVGYNRTKQVGLTAWVGDTGSGGTAYALGDYRSSDVNPGVPVDARLFVCIAAHTSSAPGAGAGLNQPGLGDDWALYWREVGLNETGLRKVPDLGECTPGGVDEQVLNVQQFVAFLRRNAELYGINPDQVCVAGASAGGQMAGCAAYAEDLAWARENQIHAASRYVPYTKTQPNALLLSITPVDLVRHTTYGLLNGLYGESISDAAWVAREAAIKQAMSPLYVLKRTGLSIPTALDYIGNGSHTAGTAFLADGSDSGLTGSPYHHPDNGWLMLRYLTTARPGGLGETTRHLFLDDASAGVYRYYTTFNGSSTSAGTSADPRDAASIILAWLNTALGV